MQENEAQKFENAKKLKDYLRKKSPRILKGWQKRYCIIATDGKQLVWFKNDKVTSKPKGYINLKDIKEITGDGSNIFHITFLDRKFSFKTDTNDQQTIWINTLEFLKGYWHHPDRIERGRSESQDSSNMEKSESYSKWKALDENSFKAIIQEKEKILIEQTNLTKNLDNRTVMQEKGIYDYLQQIKPDDVLKRRMLVGFLNKRSKGKMKYFLRRWFILISAKPLFENDQDEEILDETKLPPWMELDTLYYFKFKTEKDKTNKKGEIKMKDCLEIKVKDMKGSKEKGYSFKINMGDRLYHIMSETESEREKWAAGLTSSINTAKEMGKKKGIKKNIDNIVALFDSGKNQDEKTKNIRQKIDSDFKKLKDRYVTDDKIENFEQLTGLLDPLKTEFLDTLNACLAKEPKRTDIIKEYVDYFHEKICFEISSFWDKYYDIIGNFYYLKIIQWINNYSETLKQFFSDDRFPNGAKTLLNIYFSRTLKSSEEIVDGVVQFEKKHTPEKDENGILYSSSPFDLFKIINEIFEMSYKLCPYKDMGLKLANFAKKIIMMYQSKLQDLMEEEDLEINKFICICNNVISFTNLSKELNEKLINQCQLKPEECDKNYDSANLIKNFTSVGITAKDIIFNFFFNELNSHFNKIPTLKINLENVLSIVDKHKETLKLLHDSFARKIWKSFLEKIVICYFQSLIVSCNKAGKDDLENYITKLKEDQEYLIDQFEGILFTNTVKNEVKPFDEMVSFLEETSIFTLQQSCKSLRASFGPAFNDKAVRAIFNARSDLENHDKNDIIDACKETLSIYNKENYDKEKQDAETGRIYDLFGEGINFEDEENKTKEEEKEENNRRKSIKLDDEFVTPECSESPIKEKNHSNIITEEKFSGEGYLYKKPAKKLKMKWEKRYFRIKNGVLYWYVNDRSRECQNKILLSDIEDIFPHKNPEKRTKFKIKLIKKGKTYKFMADTPKEKSIWISAIKEELKKIQGGGEEESIVQMQVSVGLNKKPLFIDHDEIKRKENAAQALKEKEVQNETNKKNKMQNIKAKLLVKKMHDNMNTIRSESDSKKKNDMKNPNMIRTKTVKNDVNSTIDSFNDEPKNDVGCCTKFLDLLGLADRSNKDQLLEKS